MIIIAVVVVLALCTVAAWMVATRRRKLREQFGPEYERAVEAKHGRRAGERELREREERHDALDIRASGRTERDRRRKAERRPAPCSSAGWRCAIDGT
ncbi:hypothetical protein ACFRCI_46085 [Streptomyces sp. NPDC056638]|uniref:hypothetical protein n=1 Tax=Streptomyces sp. NPDC056638 TaxID=3345887 RepID=UPI003697566B